MFAEIYTIVTRFCFSYPRIHEDKVHLHEHENHLQQRIHTAQNLMARRIERRLEKGAKLQAHVDHRSQTKCYM